VESQVGVADGVFAAGLAARWGRIVVSGRTGEFLAQLPVEVLDRPELTDLLKRLGIKTLGDFASLPASDVLTRFGFDGALAHRLAAGYDHRPLAVRQPPPDLDVSDTYDEPLERVDVAAFAGRVLAERLHERLAAHGLACTRLGIEAVTADGQELHRVWRHDGMLTAVAIAERVRWQLDGWLTGARRGAPARPTAGLVRLRLVPDDVIVHLGLQPGLWGDPGAERERAHRALSRVQGLLGPDAVVTPVVDGGRSADDRARLVPWGDERVPNRPIADHVDPIAGVASVPVMAMTAEPTPIRSPSAGTGGGRGSATREGPDPDDGSKLVSIAEKRSSRALRVPPSSPERRHAHTQAVRSEGHRQPASGEVASGEAGRVVAVRRRVPALPPWPGRLPTPSPALVPRQPIGAVVLDAAGVPVGVSARLELTGDPAHLLIENGPPAPIAGWAGPWPAEERWWAHSEARRCARFQVALVDGRAFLLTLAGGHWAVAAVYD
jgi:protein ImuB